MQQQNIPAAHDAGPPEGDCVSVRAMRLPPSHRSAFYEGAFALSLY